MNKIFRSENDSINQRKNIWSVLSKPFKTMEFCPLIKSNEFCQIYIPIG